jgi:hypothetical protein
VGDQLPACQMIFDVIRDLITHGGQLKHLVFYDRIVGLLGKLPIFGRLVRYEDRNGGAAFGRFIIDSR